MTEAPMQEAGEQNSRLYLSPAVPAAKMIENMRSALARGLPEATPCRPHGMLMAVAGGGPSIADTYKDLTGFTCAVNGSLAWLLDQGFKPNACGILDAGPHIADVIMPAPGIRYYVASICDPAVFDKLRGCDVVLWHTTPHSTEDPDGVMALLNAERPQKWHAIGGYCTMGLRWINLGYFLGFRRFHLHGLDSSFRGQSTHAYPDRADTKDRLTFNGRETRPNFLAQVYDFFGVINTMRARDPSVEIEVFGDGLLQDEWNRWCAEKRHEAKSHSEAEARVAEILKRLPDGPVKGAEIGVFAGAMSYRLLERRDLSLIMVDSWEGAGAAYADKADWHASLSQTRQDEYFDIANRATGHVGKRRRILRMRSLDAAKQVDDASLDFVFLDADHSEAGCADDIRAWLPKVKPGGFIGGHDYGNSFFPGVSTAVDAAFASVERGDNYTWFARC